jgi:hypothetical protein
VGHKALTIEANTDMLQNTTQSPGLETRWNDNIKMGLNYVDSFYVPLDKVQAVIYVNV